MRKTVLLMMAAGTLLASTAIAATESRPEHSRPATATSPERTTGDVAKTCAKVCPITGGCLSWR